MAEVWQEKRKFEETNLSMLNDDVLCDVTFLVGTNKDEVKAHKFMLASRSPVFFAMFCGPMSETSSTIEIPDIEVEIMSTFLRFIYSEDCTLNGESVMALLYTAKKYNIKRLEQKCQTFVLETISCENVCILYAQAHMLSEMQLKHNCFKFILTNGEQILQTEGFRTLPKELLKDILESDDIRATEEDIYDGCIQWATYQLHSAEESRDVSHSDIRNVLGDLLYLIRFPTLSIKTFSTKFSSDDILSPDEKVSIFQFISAGSKDEHFKFIDKKRIGRFIIKIITRLPERSPHGCYTVPYAIDILVSEKAMLRGVGLFSPCKAGTVKGVVSLLDASKTVLIDADVEMAYSPSNYHQVVLFDEDTVLEPGVKYTIKVALKGVSTFNGCGGFRNVTEGDFSITFSDSDINQSGTNVAQGQIPLLVLGIKNKI